LGRVFTRAQAVQAGQTRGEIAWALRSGRWMRLRRGAFCLPEVYAAADDRGRHLLHAEAALLTHDERHVLSHVSAALSFGLPTPFRGLGRPTLTLPGSPASTDRQADLVVQVAGLAAGDTTTWRRDRLRTSVARTVADCLRHLERPEAVMLCDAALHAGLTEPVHIDRVLSRQANWPYAERGRAAFKLSDGRRESPLESWSFVQLYARGVPLPVPQALVYDGRSLVGRVDGWWPEYGTVCEVDGREKYSMDLGLRAVQDGPEDAERRIASTRRAIVEEKLREDRLRALGLQVVRWGFVDVVRRIGRVVADIEAAWGRGRPDLVTGRILPPGA
jgi:hypothetical protein